jgi:hypothetical protein
MSLLTTSEHLIDRETEATFRAAIKRLIDEALEAGDDPAAIEHVCEQWDELLREFRALERDYLLAHMPTAEELSIHKLIYQQVILLAGLLGAALERVHKIGWNLEASTRSFFKERVESLGDQKEELVFRYNGWHGPRLSPAHLELAKKVLCVLV